MIGEFGSIRSELLLELGLISVHTLAIGRKKGELKRKMTNKETILSDATRALQYDARLKIVGGYDLTHKPCCYGILLKWILGVRRISYGEFAKKLNGTTRQNLNSLINRADKSRFFPDVIESICKALGVTTEYFYDVAKKIEELMEKGDGSARG